MAADGAKRTAAGAGVMRALEQHAERPLFDDPLAGRLLTGWTAVMVANRVLRGAFLRALDRAGPGFYGAVVCRTRAIDDACRDALAGGVRQVVIVGAGMDTRPYRMPEMSAARVWELDLPAVQAGKRAALARVLTEPPGHVRYAPVDLTTDRLDDVLARAGAGRTLPTLVLCEAVLMYLPAAATDNLLRYAGGLPPGSRLVLTYLPRDVRDDPRHAGWSRRLAWRTALDPPEIARHLAGHGLRVRADLGADEHQRLILRPAGRHLTVFAGERTAIADT
ncbi:MULTISPECIES: class I SAM-dependent methyltransferase [Catenuloplanes]|uniref:S-adenosyl-L-methionine-dependent methyltransferase n=1 Tax=Catenuloplanes niger TaxID=587534 RepID=A0AAE3ZKV6_9ACTN|nr:SAM-dependent methyltransferase [Catenuloplanes niger]MDR7320018.1 methyltransferase (TIGR00027 family) [Catenuloplanes niger]